ncbi:MAG: hypothetical protein Q7J56_02680 [Deltaproteobacteria bacterium]|nr:hypothetical protein [Deltaproteobacteria bacterium]MDP2730313.1 hypothetical protein [Dehalococcoidales bacterium]
MDPNVIQQILVNLGFGGAILILWWVDRKDKEKLDKQAAAEREKKEEGAREERRQEGTLNREVLTNHLSQLIGEDIKSREKLAIALAELSKGLDYGQKNCAEIRGQFASEVNRMKTELDK